MSRTCYIIGAGDFINDVIKKDIDDIVICADAGYLHALNNNIKADLIIGDFDSLKQIPDDISIIRAPVIKDETDVALCINEGIKRGYKKFRLYGCLGKRIEHSLANIILLLAYDKYDTRIIENNMEMFIMQPKDIYKDTNKTGYISLFSITNKSLLTIKGLKYELDSKEINNQFPLGIDNEALGKDFSIELIKGKLLVITRFDN